MKKTLPIVIVLTLIIGGGAFYGGMKYGESKSPFKTNLSQEQRQQLFQGNVGGSLEGSAGRRVGAGFLSGEVIAKDGQSITLKMPDGGSKIVFFADSTQISKTAEGSITDIEIGKQIMITGQQNSDGSYTAKTIQLSPRLITL